VPSPGAPFEGTPGEVPRFEQSGYDPGVLQDLERGAIPKGWESAASAKAKVRRYYAFNATNKCCRSWMLLGWPDDGDGHPDKLVSDGPRLGLDCPKCGKIVYIDLGGPYAVVMSDKHQPPALVNGRVKGI
jgi:hypothetical protein